MAKDYVVNLTGKDGLSKTIQNVKKELHETAATATEIDKIQEKFIRVAESSAPLKRQLADLKKLMGEMEFKGLSNTAQYTNIAKYAGSVKDSMADAAQAINAFSSDTATLDAIKSGFQGLAGGVSAVTGGLNLLGVKSDGVQKAMMKAQSAIALMNGVQMVANTLNKSFALILKLKSISLLGNTAATTANSVAETANTAAVVSNTAAEGANVTATNAATAAQIAHNAAVMANPYVLAAMAIALVVGGLVAWAVNSDDATDSQIALNAAVEAFNEAADSEMKKAAESISLYDKLKKQYDSSGKKVDDFAKKLINNKDVQQKLGVVVKTVDDVHRLFANNTDDYTKAALARASAMAAEAAQAAILGSTLSELSKLYAKLNAGEEVNWKDMRKVVEAAGYSKEAADRMMYNAGFKYEGEGIFAYGDVVQGSGNLQKLFDEIVKGGAIKELSQMAADFQKNFNKIADIDFNGLLTNNFNALGDAIDNAEKKTTKAGKTTKKETKETKDELNKVLTTLEGCDAIISDAEKAMKKLDRTSADYTQKVAEIKKILLGARAAKLLMIDKSTLKGINEMRKILGDIINDLPEGSKDLAEWQKKLDEANLAAYEMAKALSKNGDMQSLTSVKKEIDTIINSLPKGSKDLEKWGKLWREIDESIKDSNEQIDNIKKGIEDGSIAKLNQKIKKLQEELTNKNLTTEARIKLNDEVDELQKEVNRLTKGQLSIEAKVKPTYAKVGKESDLMQSYANAQAQITEIQDNWKHGIIQSRKEANEAIADLNGKLKALGMKPIVIHLQADFERFTKALKEGFSSIDSVVSMVDAFASLSSAIEENKNGWEILKASISAVESVLSTISTVMATVNAIQELFNITSAKTAATKMTEVGANTAAMTAEETKSLTDVQATATAVAATAALKAQEAAYLDMAAAAIFAAHAPIPFAGVGIASGQIAAMMAAMTAQQAASLALTAFATGGIVGGTSYSGDRVLARLNSGEMVLNGHQQARLFNAINSGMLGGGEVTFKIKGSDLYGTIKNYTSIKSKTMKL